MEDFLLLLKKAILGDESAIAIILINFKEQKFLPAEQEQIHFYLKQAARNNHNAIYIRGLLYEHGHGIKQDTEMAFLLMREAASKGSAKATYEVARYFLYGIGIEQNNQNAFQWLKIAASSPHYIPDAMYELGRVYELGMGVRVDLLQAKEWYEKAARKGHQTAKEAFERMK